MSRGSVVLDTLTLKVDAAVKKPIPQMPPAGVALAHQLMPVGLVGASASSWICSECVAALLWRRRAFAVWAQSWTAVAFVEGRTDAGDYSLSVLV
jgi:hypothetical protein